jgi:hypothetical protein
MTYPSGYFLEKPYDRISESTGQGMIMAPFDSRIKIPTGIAGNFIAVPLDHGFGIFQDSGLKGNKGINYLKGRHGRKTCIGPFTIIEIIVILFQVIKNKTSGYCVETPAEYLIHMSQILTIKAGTKPD